MYSKFTFPKEDSPQFGGSSVEPSAADESALKGILKRQTNHETVQIGLLNLMEILIFYYSVLPW